MRLRVAAFALLASLFTAAPAKASTQFTFVNGGSTTAFGFYVGPYNGLRGTSPGTAVVLNCVDFFNVVRNGDVWQANLTSLATGVGIGTNTRSGSLSAYRQAAWLTTQYAANPGQTAAIQATIWRAMPGSANLPANVVASNAPFWSNAAVSAQSTFNASGFYVVTDVNFRTAGSIQEFIIYDPTLDQPVVATPEPRSLVLLATGFIGLLGVSVRRRKG